MWLFYLDESGNPELSGPSKCYILAAVGIPVNRWTACDKAINQLKYSYNMPEAEIHTAWMLRDYKEQHKIDGFKELACEARREAVIRERERLIEEKKSLEGATNAALKSIRKNFKNTEAYIHLTYYERQCFVRDLACKFKSWKNARLFAEIMDKEGYTPP